MASLPGFDGWLASNPFGFTVLDREAGEFFLRTKDAVFPGLTIAQVMGAPLDDAPRLHHWSNWIQRQFDAQSLIAERERIEQAVAEFYEYEDELIARRRSDPGEDLISALVEAEAEGERLSDD